MTAKQAGTALFLVELPSENCSNADVTRRRLVRILLPLAAVLVVAATVLALLDWPWLAAPVSTTTQPAPKVVDVDVLIYGTQTSGLAALRELEIISPSLKVALVSGQQALESPLAQGLCVEDRYPATPVVGFYKEWRDRVMAEYRAGGKEVLAPGGRLSYEPEIAKQALEGLISGNGSRPLVFIGQLLSAADGSSARYAIISSETGELLRINTKYFIDASVEADLARMLGADYRLGSSEATYNDIARRVPPPPSQQNGFVTAPQKMATLLTLQVFSAGAASPVSSLSNPNYDPASYSGLEPFSQKNVTAFESSWTMTIAVLPNGKRELNEAWNDWPDNQIAFDWVFHPEKRKEIAARVLEWSINRVRYLQEHGYPNMGVAQVPDLPYVREGPRVVGIDTYTDAEVADGVSNESIAVGLYARFDRHQNVSPTFISTPTAVHVPMGAIMPAGHPWLLVTTAISADYRAYCSAVRMEPTRANIGGAGGIITALALRRGVSPAELTYVEVRSELVNRGYGVD